MRELVRDHTGKPYASCKTVRLCDTVERSLIHRHKNEPLERLKERSELIYVGYAKASPMLVLPLRTASDFLDRLRELHLTMFARGDEQIAGRFRNDNEQVAVDEGRHAFEGVPGSQIEQHLRSLFENDYASLQRSPNDKHTFSLCASIFLVRFFDIHPFVDGNGRIARLLAIRAAQFVGGWRFDARSSTGRQRRAYLAALRYARRHNDPTKTNNRFHYLAKWMERHLLERAPLDQSEHEPEWLKNARR